MKHAITIKPADLVVMQPDAIRYGKGATLDGILQAVLSDIDFTVEIDAAGLPACDIADGTLKPYSVLLLYPDYANDDGTETYYAWVEASDPIEAVAAAQREAVSANDCVEIDPGDFIPLLVTEGHHHGLPMSNA